jgi:hypothetical protein
LGGAARRGKPRITEIAVTEPVDMGHDCSCKKY